MPWNGEWLGNCDCCRIVDTTYRARGKRICAVCRWLCQSHLEDAVCIVARAHAGALVAELAPSLADPLEQEHDDRTESTRAQLEN